MAAALNQQKSAYKQTLDFLIFSVLFAPTESGSLIL